MKTTLSLSYLLTLLILSLSSCSTDRVMEEITTEVSPQMTLVPPSCEINGSNTGNMEFWRPYMETALNCSAEDGEYNGYACNQTNPVQTQTKSFTLCYLPEEIYNTGQANDFVTDAIVWAVAQRPASSFVVNNNGSGPGIASMIKWIITSYTIDLDPNPPCHTTCPNVIPLRVKVTYTRFSCHIVAEHPTHQLAVARLEIDGPPTGGPGSSDGQILFEARPIKDLSDGDDEADGGDDSDPGLQGINIKGPNGNVIQVVVGHSPDPETGFTTFRFEVQDYPLAALTLQLF